MSKSPLISVVMNAYNKEKYISRTIGSILNQTFGDFEFIIVNDGSTDKTTEKIAQYHDPRIRVLYHENAGIRYTLNRGFSEAKGKYIAHIDADDESTSDRLRLQYEFMEKHPDCVLVGCWCKVIDENDHLIEEWRPPTDDSGIRWAHLFDNVIGHSGFFIRRNAMTNGEWYQLPYTEEYDLAVRLGEIGKLACIPEFFVIYRDMVESGIMHSKWTEQKSYAEKISMRQLTALMGKNNITLKQRRAAWKLINRPWQIHEPELTLAIHTIRKIADAFYRAYPQADNAVNNAFALYSKKMLLPAEGGRINQLRHLHAAMKLRPRITDARNILAALIYLIIGPQNGYQLVRRLKGGSS